MGVVLALVFSVAFGAADQYLGSLAGSGHAWAAGWSSDVSGLSAPWLVLPFIAGLTQRDPRRAALLGLSCTYAALVGYFLMTDSSIENAHYSLANARGFWVTNGLFALGGLVTGPVFGWVGSRWRARRALLGALVLSGALCLEPLVRQVSASPIRFRNVWLGEIAAGLVLAGYAALNRARSWRYQT